MRGIHALKLRLLPYELHNTKNISSWPTRRRGCKRLTGVSAGDRIVQEPPLRLYLLVKKNHDLEESNEEHVNWDQANCA